MTNLGILLSGQGTNFLAIADAITSGALPNATIAVVLSNNSAAPGLAAAHARNIPAIPILPDPGASQDQQILTNLRNHNVNLVCLAGYMRLLSPTVVAAYRDRILNIHPSLLPAFPGLQAQQQAINHGVHVAGCTVHFVDEQLDHGAIVMQQAVPVQPGDTAQTLAARILVQEHALYPQAIARVLSNTYRIDGSRYVPASQVTPTTPAQ